MHDDCVEVAGKYFIAGGQKWFVKGFSYGPFAPNSTGDFLPGLKQLRADFAQLRQLGANCVRVYHPPSRQLLDIAFEAGMRVFVDVPWQKHRCFFEDWDARHDALQRVRLTAKQISNHPGLFAISVGNEIPADVIRYHGAHAVSRFVAELIDAVKQTSPKCLTTYVNFPTTEFLAVAACDFHCFNVYLHDQTKLAAYLDHLQHVAGNQPLLLGEYGVDTLRHGEEQQATMLTQHLQQVFRRGLAGTFIFSFTDDWYTGGHQIEDWSFGVTTRNRMPKISAAVVRDIWQRLPEPLSNPPRVSVVVCSYNGGATLRECLMSLMNLDYPNYEVILVDDGSTDNTRDIATEFPQVVYRYQCNQGLSVARNVGAQLASGEIVAYTDSDCVADEHWLVFLVQAMRDQNVEAIGGPNVSPESDGWIAKCIAASPGNPSHVMLDDQHAEHVPGCNMAIRRQTLLGLGGFDPQFRQAGDDVDICWRLLDANLPIGYAPGAMVWHHRRATISAFIKQQRGYGRSEAMVHFKHPQRCSTFRRSRWHGIIYGDGAVGLHLLPETIYHGHFGGGLFQTIYRHNDYGAWAVLISFEWHLLSAFLLLLGTLLWPLSSVSIGMWIAPVLLAIRSATQAPLPNGAPRWCRPLVAFLYFAQPIVRGFYRLTHLLSKKRLPTLDIDRVTEPLSAKRISAMECDAYWQSDRALGREKLLDALVKMAKRLGWYGDFGNAWAPWDIKLIGDRWHDIIIRTATEELGWPDRFTRARCTVRSTRFSDVVATCSILWSTAATISQQPWAIAIGLLTCVWTLISIRRSRRRCLSAVSDLVARAGERSGLKSVLSTCGIAESQGTPREPVDHRSTNTRTVTEVASRSVRKARKRHESADDADLIQLDSSS